MAKLFFLMALISLGLSCSEPDPFAGDLTGNVLKSTRPVTVTVPFKGEVYTNNTAVPYDVTNPYNPVFKFTCAGTGIASHMGEMAYLGEFLAKPVQDIMWQMPGKAAVLTADNGDELHISLGVRIVDILPTDENDPPEFYEKFMTDVDIVGGTGRFEGATGTLHMIVLNIPPLAKGSYITFEGPVTMVRGNR